MATYVNDLRLKEITTGDESGTWGTSTNTNFELIGEALQMDSVVRSYDLRAAAKLVRSRWLLIRSLTHGSSGILQVTH